MKSEMVAYFVYYEINIKLGSPIPSFVGERKMPTWYSRIGCPTQLRR